MPSSWWRPSGLRPTLRHQMILVAYFALLFALAVPSFRGGTPAIAALLVALSPPLMAVLILVLDRPGPVKYWLVGLIASATLPVIVAWLDWLIVSRGAFDESLGVVLVLGVLNALGLASLVRTFRRLPGRCTACGRRSVLPLARLRWCASCGSRTVLRPGGR